MFKRWSFTSPLFLIVSFIGTFPAIAEPAQDPVAFLVKRSLPFIEKEGANWIEQKKCVSCHQVPAMLWSLNKAAAGGFDVDKEKLKAWSRWSHQWQNWNGALSGTAEDKSVNGNNDTIAQLLMAQWPQLNQLH